MMCERIKYQDIKIWYLHSAYENILDHKFAYRDNLSDPKFSSRDNFIQEWKENEDEWGYAYYDWETNFDCPIEYFMFYVISLITNCAKGQVAHDFFMKKIKSFLDENDLQKMISDFTSEEREEFLSDLKLVLNNQEIE
ncbi:hypothetical protein KRX19_02020 [Cardiobacteriaceae bacterium TAE3-ERU3]|nr:hypothetical protein [Cardiobacteriaceae bacterium TAE3-ERU3]